MKAVAILTLFALQLAACTSSVDDSMLVGTWGGPSVKVLASPAGVRLSFSCGGTGQTDRAVALDAAGAFIVPGVISDHLQLGARTPHDTVSGSSIVVGVLATISGTIVGDDLTLTIQSSQSGVAPITVTAQRNHPGPSGNEICRD